MIDRKKANSTVLNWAISEKFDEYIGTEFSALHFLEVEGYSVSMYGIESEVKSDENIVHKYRIDVNLDDFFFRDSVCYVTVFKDGTKDVKVCGPEDQMDGSEISDNFSSLRKGGYTGWM